MTEFLKGYAAGANDMEAGRLVTEVEKWRQYQHKAANEAWKWKARADAAEAKLAGVEKDYESAEAQIDRLESSMDRARKLAEGTVEGDEFATNDARQLAREIARILSGDE